MKSLKHIYRVRLVEIEVPLSDLIHPVFNHAEWWGTIRQATGCVTYTLYIVSEEHAIENEATHSRKNVMTPLGWNLSTNRNLAAQSCLIFSIGQSSLFATLTTEWEKNVSFGFFHRHLSGNSFICLHWFFIYSNILCRLLLNLNAGLHTHSVCSVYGVSTQVPLDITQYKLAKVYTLSI